MTCCRHTFVTQLSAAEGARVSLSLSLRTLRSPRLVLLRLSERRNRAIRRAQVVCRCNENLQTANTSRDENTAKQFYCFVHIYRKVALGRERRHTAADVAGKRLQFFHRDKLDFS